MSGMNDAHTTPVTIETDLPTEVLETIEDNRRHPERLRPRPARPPRTSG